MTDTTTTIDELSLADWRRRVATLYVEVRRLYPSDPDAALDSWRRGREALYRSHPQSPVLRELRQNLSTHCPGFGNL